MPRGQGADILGSLDPLADAQDGGEEVTGSSRIPCIFSPAAEFLVDGQDVRVLRS